MFDLDRNRPVRGCVVPFETIQDIIVILKGNDLSPRLSGRLQEMFKEQEGPAETKLEAICRIAERSRKTK